MFALVLEGSTHVHEVLTSFASLQEGRIRVYIYTYIEIEREWSTHVHAVHVCTSQCQIYSSQVWLAAQGEIKEDGTMLEQKAFEALSCIHA